ncbi:hypothetical protein Clacol_004818 [Clathrus columnatus]|uniref:Uncharacterized protein n=1 Tax=Clathrus columnatus TaxID=1419009 RepID=A0AAV5A7I8_9AGAM|nr:hypothetical protein Clacol_004818 [Clathrus columnatus]
MMYPEDSLAYFNNGKQFHLKALFPNLTDLFINIQNDWFKDPYRALFPHFMPKTVKNVHIDYTFTEPEENAWPLFYRSRVTPIRYPSTPHHLKRLSVSGVFPRIGVARLWESLFKVEELIVDGMVLPVGEDAPWGLDMGQVCDMLQFGCKGIGWHWGKGRPFYPSDMTFAEHYALGHMPDLPPPLTRSPVKHRRKVLLEPEDSFRRIRRSKSFSYLRNSPKPDNQKMTRPVMIRRKTFVVLPMTDYPYYGTG